MTMFSFSGCSLLYKRRHPLFMMSSLFRGEMEQAKQRVRFPDRSGPNNPFYGKKHTEETKKKLKLAWQSQARRLKTSLGQMGINNSFWKGDNVKSVGLHRWVRRHLPEPDKCQICNKEPPYDLANISGKYKRSLDDWQWLCRRCHMLSDGRTAKIMQHIKQYKCLPGTVRSNGIRN